MEMVLVFKLPKNRLIELSEINHHLMNFRQSIRLREQLIHALLQDICVMFFCDCHSLAKVGVHVLEISPFYCIDDQYFQNVYESPRN